MAGYPFHHEVQECFPDFDYNNPVGDRNVLCDMANPNNKVGQQQRAFTTYWALKTCGPLDLGLDLGAHRGLTPFCIHLDLYGAGAPHPFYGGGAYISDVIGNAADLSIFPKGAFPYIASNHSLEHMPVSGDSGATALLIEWMARLRPGGLLALVLPDNDFNDVLKMDADHKHAWGASDFRRRILDPAGVHVVEYDTFHNKFSFNVLLKRPE